MLKLNSLSNTLFECSAENDVKVAVNGANISRNDLVATGRLIAAEKMGNMISTADNRYNSRLEESGLSYKDVMEKHRDALLLFCAARANAEVGKEAPSDVNEVKRNARAYSNNEVFFKTLAAITIDVISPIFASVYEDIGSRGLMQVVNVPFGGTYQLDVKSNDIFLFEDGSWGSSRSTSKNYLYGKTLTLNPRPFTCNATIKFYQDVVTGDVGDYYASIMKGMWNKIYALFIQALTTGAANTAYVPTGLIAQSYTTENWIRIKELVAAVNGVDTSDLIAFGSAAALSQILPVDAQGNALVGLQYGLGEQWFREGYLPKAAEVSVVKVPPVIIPGTQNTTVSTLGFGDDIYITARAGRGYAPVYMGVADDTPIELVRDARSTADFTIDINVTMAIDVKAVFASKIGVIKG